MKRVWAIALALTLAVPAPALADFAMPTVPSIVPDLGCVVGWVVGGGKCITFTESGTIAQVQSEIMQIRNLTTMSSANLFNAVAQRIAAITQTAQANPTRSGDAAAADAMYQAQIDAEKQQWLNGAGGTASGAEQRAQLAAASTSITNSELMSGNVMQAAQIKHTQTVEDASQSMMDGATTNATDAKGFQ